MIKQLILISIFLFSWIGNGQVMVSGTVTDDQDQPLKGANVYIEGTYDGASTDEIGNFKFETFETGTQILVVSMMGFETHYQPGDISYFNEVQIKMSEAINTLSGVTLTAGTFEAGDNSKASVLKPLDIVTTAGAAGDFVAALQTLPGTSKVSENGRLFVRGGEAGETQVFIDGLRVFQPFNATANNIPTRGRFSPFLFKGITFSTGGYSAEYGQALSSVLLLNTTDIPDQEKTDLSIMSVGGGLGHTEIWEDESLSINTSYINLEPYEALIPSDQGVRWNKPYESASGEAVFRSRRENGFLKLYTGFTHSNLDIDQEDINYQDFIQFRLKNNNLYLNGSYKHFFDKEWTLSTGASVSYDTNALGLIDDTIDTKETGSHIKLKLQKGFSNRFNLCLGTEYLFTDYQEIFGSPDGFSYDAGFTDHLGAAFVEGDIFLSNRFAMKLGVRAEHSDVLTDFNVVPRASVAYKSSEKGQFSLAYGTFYQNPLTEYVRYDQNLEAEKTSHYILNYQYLGKGRTFRAETYYKDYDNLLKYDTDLAQFNSNFSNSGSGYATGLDIFWRDNKSVDYLDYWVSYSYLNTERDYRNFREAATPNFAPKHSASVVAKYFVTDWRSQIGLSYSYGSGRTYNDPNVPAFMAGKTISYNNLSVNCAYLIDAQKILYFSVNNVLGFKNINNYQYASAPDANGNFDRRALRPAADSFFFVGFFWTISADKKSNQLDNL